MCVLFVQSVGAVLGVWCGGGGGVGWWGGAGSELFADLVMYVHLFFFLLGSVILGYAFV